MEQLGKDEGMKVHTNVGESDITSAYGVFREAHPTAVIFKYYDEVATELGIVVDSKLWTGSVLSRVNQTVDKDIEYQLVEEFYEEFLANAHLSEFPVEAKVAMYSCYTNSPKKAMQAVQQALINMQVADRLDVARSSLSTVDGSWGEKTSIGLAAVEDGVLLEIEMLFCMTQEYINLWKQNPEKYGRYLLGWANRMDKLAKTK